MASYSAYNWRTGQFDVYTSGNPNALDTEPPTRARLGAGKVGAPIESILRSLPLGVKLTGSSEAPVGEVVRPRGGSSLLGLDDLQWNSIWPWVAAGVVAYVAWKRYG